MSKKAFIFYAAVTPAGARKSLYREDLGLVPGKVKSDKAYDQDVTDIKAYIADILADVEFLPTNMGELDMSPVDDAIDLLFTNPQAGMKNSAKASIHEVYDNVNNRVTTQLKLVTKVNGDRSVVLLDIDPV